MNFTGDVNQDYNYLVNLYNQSGKIMLTGNKDVDYSILSELNEVDLSRVCRTNKYSSQLCNDDDFWLYKFDKEKLDILIKPKSGHALSTEWMKLYKIVKLASIHAKYSLIVYNIQYSTKPTKQQPAIIINNKRKDRSLNLFLEKVNEKSSDKFLVKTLEYNVLHINIRISNKITLTLYYWDHKHPNKKIPTDIITISSNDCIKLLTYAYQFSWPNYEAFTVLCDNIPLIVTQDFLDIYGGNAVSYKRSGILESIIYYEQ